jgi:hypothetical protein
VTLREQAHQRAGLRDNHVQTRLDSHRLPAPRNLLTLLRAYLLRQREEANHPGNQVESELKVRKSSRVWLINIGPTTHRGNEPPYVLASGAKLSFGVTVREDSSTSCSLVSYRFDYRQSAVPALPLVRFELRDSNHSDSLREPRVHIHPGLETIRLPTALIDPIEVLDLLFFVIDPDIASRNNLISNGG